MKVDCHCHILPGIDDGAQTLDEAVFLAGKLVQWGYGRAVCTSHRASLYRNTPSTVMAACELLRAELDRREIPLELVPSMEYRLIPDTWTAVREGNWLLPWEGNHILVELPIHDPTKVGDLVPLDEIRWLIGQGYQPVLAHPERYRYMTAADYKRLHEMGVLFQLNLPSVLGVYGEGTMRRAAELLEKGWYTMAGSDCHRMRSITGQYSSKVLKSAQIKQLEPLMKEA